MTAWLKSNSATIWTWAACIGGAAILFGLTRGTHYQQFGAALLISLIALLVAMAVFEAIWMTAARWFGVPDGAATPPAPKSRDRRR